MVSLFDSPLTTDDLEVPLQHALKTESRFGPNVFFTDLGDGKGIVSEVGLLTADWTPADSSLPATFAVKVAAPKKPAEGNRLAELAQLQQSDERRQRLVNYHNTEILILSKLEEYVPSARVPKVYAAKKRTNYDDPGYIIMKNYEGIDSSLHMNNNLPEEAIDSVLRELAKIHSSSRFFKPEEKIKLENNMFQSTFNVLFEGNMIKNLGKMAKNFGGEMMATETEELPSVLEEMSRPEYLKFVDETCKHLGILELLCHGDVWMCNMLWKRTGDEEFELQALIDLQTAQFGCPVADLVRLFTGCMSGKARRDDYLKHIRAWWGYTKEEGEMPYSFEDILEAFYRFFPCCAFVVAGSIAAVAPNIINKQPNENKKHQAHKNLLEKQQALLQDIIKYHKRNMAIIREQK